MALASESTHWYDAKTGEPRYEVPRADGKGTRATTLRDARVLGYVPSVTTILRAAGAPWPLVDWMVRQHVLAALTLPQQPGESTDAFALRVVADAKREGEQARDAGTAIHAAIERHHRGEIPDADLLPWVRATNATILATCGDQAWSAEKSFAHELGYGGKCDLHSPAWVLDVKSKDGPADEKRRVWDEELMQLAAYRRGLGLDSARCGIVHVDRNAPHATLIEASADELDRGLRMFDGLLSFWYAKTGLRRD